MKAFIPYPKFRAVDNDTLLPLVGGKLYAFAAGTSTPLATYTDYAGGTANTHPVVLDVNGEADIWISNAQYKFVLKDANDVTIWTEDYITHNYIYGEDITWTGNHTFNGTVEFNDDVIGTLSITGATTISDNLYVTGNLDVDGTSTFAGTVNVDELSTSLITLGAAGTISDQTGVMQLSGANNITLKVDNAAFTYDFQESGLLRLPVQTPVNSLDAASKGYVDTKVAAAITAGMQPVAIGAVVSNSLVTGSIGVTSVNHTGTGTYDITLTSATTSTGKTIVFTTPRYDSVNRNHTVMPQVNSTTSISIWAGNGNSFALADTDFNFVVYSLP